MSRRHATGAGAILIGLLAFAVLAASVSAAAAAARSTRRTVTVRGYQFGVPASWRVFDLARDPSTCVRFNRHAVYVGTPSANQRCPAQAIGRTEAVLVQPVAAAAASASQHRTGTIVRGHNETISYVIRSAGLRVTATWSGDRKLLSQVLRRRVPPPSAGQPQAGAARTVRASPSTTTPNAAVYTGLGFDACTAPSSRAMSAWRSNSSYRAIGVYIGGLNAACSQPNLTASWVGAEVAAGWHLIPTYVGLQAAGGCGGCATISPGKASAQGAAAAVDAVNQAQALGIPAGNPIYDDMEAYNETSSNRSAAMTFLSGWTKQLHAEGYVSGVYSSASSAIADLVHAEGTGYLEPDDIWIGDWNGSKSTNDPYVPSSYWANRQRLHQYSGGHNETHGGITINIDGDYLNGATANTSSPIPNGTFVQVSGHPAIYRIAGGAPLYVSNWTPFGGSQPVKVISQQVFKSLPPYPANGTFLTTSPAGVSYRVAGGAPLVLTTWSIFGAVQAAITIDQWDVANIINPLARLRPTPANGTLVEGLPSRTYWTIESGTRIQTTANPAAIAVDDQSLTAFPINSGAGGTPLPKTKPAPKCVVPRLKHMTLPRARGSLRKAHCAQGKIRRPRHWPRRHVLRVFGQSATWRSAHRSGFKVNLWLK